MLSDSEGLTRIPTFFETLLRKHKGDASRTTLILSVWWMFFALYCFLTERSASKSALPWLLTGLALLSLSLSQKRSIQTPKRIACGLISLLLATVAVYAYFHDTLGL